MFHGGERSLPHPPTASVASTMPSGTTNSPRVLFAVMADSLPTGSRGGAMPSAAR